MEAEFVPLKAHSERHLVNVSMRAISATVTQFLHLQSFINYGPKDDRERFMVIFVAEEIVYKAILGGK